MLFQEIIQAPERLVHNSSCKASVHNSGMSTHILAQCDDGGKLSLLSIVNAKHVLQEAHLQES